MRRSGDPPHELSDRSRSEFKIVYDTPKDQQTAYYAELIKQADLLQMVPAAIAEAYKLKPGITIRATNCSEPNAFWDAETREITYCYELAQLYAELIVRHFSRQQGKQP